MSDELVSKTTSVYIPTETLVGGVIISPTTSRIKEIDNQEAYKRV